MKQGLFLSLLAAGYLLLGQAGGQSPSPPAPQMTDGTKCKLKILKQMADGKLFSDTLNLSGKYLNELGNYNQCVANKGNDSMKYELKTYRSNKSDGEGLA